MAGYTLHEMQQQTINIILLHAAYVRSLGQTLSALPAGMPTAVTTTPIK
jgi:hypothetical protein